MPSPKSPPASAPVASSASAAPPVTERLHSLDAYRGLVMLAMASSGLGLAAVAKHHTDSRLWQALAYQFEHVPWLGCSFWDLIQPSFMFLVGTSMAYSYVKRQALGQSYRSMFLHALSRAAILILLGVFLRSNGQKMTNYTFVDVLAQIGLGYPILFLLWGRKPALQLGVAGAILVGYWALFAAWPLPGPDFDYAAVGVPADWRHLSGFAAHWDMNTNPASALDVWLLNKFPQAEPFRFNKGGYATLNFVPSLATMIFGLMAGELLRGPRRPATKFWALVAAGLAGLAIGQSLEWAGICPAVKRIWTPSWAIYSTGWTCLILAAFYAAVDLLPGGKRWAFPLVIVGMNSIAVYCLAGLSRKWFIGTLETHLGAGYAKVLGEPYAPLVQSLSVVLVLWLIALWMYRQKIFVRI